MFMRNMSNMVLCKCQYKNVGKMEYKNVGFPITLPNPELLKGTENPWFGMTAP